MATTVCAVASVTYDGLLNEKGEYHDDNGTLIWSNGDQYNGSFRNGQREGHGTITWQAGGEYVGEWHANCMHGTGTRRYVNGNMYNGEYDQNQRHGNGRLYYANGDMYHGEWMRDKMQGEGRYYYQSGQSFEGTFVDSQRHGKGKLQRTDGTLEIFLYEKDVRVGNGVRWSKDRTQTWKIWYDAPKKARTGQFRVATEAKTKRITIADAVGLGYDIDRAAASSEDENLFNLPSIQ